MRVLIVALLAAISYAQTGTTGPSKYSKVVTLGCSQPDNNQRTEKYSCDGTTLTLEKYESNDCSGTPMTADSGDGPESWTDLATCKAQPDFVGDDENPMKVTIECEPALNIATITLCGDSAANHCTITEDGDKDGCLQDMCKELCCTPGTSNEAYLNAFWSDWSMSGNCECGDESVLRTRKSDLEAYPLEGKITIEMCATECTDKCNSAKYDKVFATLRESGTTACTALFAALDAGNGPSEDQLDGCYKSKDFPSISGSNYDCKMDCGDSKTVKDYIGSGSTGDSSASSICLIMAMITTTIWAF